MKKRKITFILILIVLLIFLSSILFFKVKSFNTNKLNFEKYSTKFSEGSSYEIEDWMSVSFVENYYNISDERVEEIFGLDLKFKEERKSIKEICKKNDLECGPILLKLNQEIENG